MSTRGFTVSKHILVANKRFQCIIHILVVNKMFHCIYTYFGCQQEVWLTVSIHIVAYHCGCQQEVSLYQQGCQQGFTVSKHILVVNKRFHCIYTYCGWRYVNIFWLPEVSLYLYIFWLSTRCFMYLNIFWLSTKGFTVSIHIVAANKRFHCI